MTLQYIQEIMGYLCHCSLSHILPGRKHEKIFFGRLAIAIYSISLGSKVINTTSDSEILEEADRQLERLVPE